MQTLLFILICFGGATHPNFPSLSSIKNIQSNPILLYFAQINFP